MMPRTTALVASLLLAACTAVPHREPADETEIVVLEFAQADEVATVIEDFHGSAVEVAVDARTNSVLLKGEHADLVEVKDLIVQLDVELR